MPFFDRIGAGVQKIKSNPQLIYTVLIAVCIVAAFVFMANRFIGIAVDAQDRLVNVRIGSLQDAFVSFAADALDTPEYLNARIADVVRTNETIRSFRVIEKQLVIRDATTTEYIIIASNDVREIGESISNAELIYALVSGNVDHSVTTQSITGGERTFTTARAIVNAERNVVAVALTTQTLSQADRAIEQNITDSVYILIGIIAMIMFLFLRHSRIIDYMDLYRRLKEVDQLKDDFISMASHELRSPMTIIRGYADVLLNSPDLNAESKAYVKKIEDGAIGLDAFIADMLDVSRIEQGRMQFTLQRVVVRDLLSSVVHSFDVVAKEKGLALSFNAATADAVAIMADPDRLRQVLVNLIGNAIKYTPHGEVEVSQSVTDGKVLIRVRDTGLGISAEHREKLFQKFYRVHTSETEAITGTGLGLWITAQMVREMRGTITVESIVGVGSHFIVSFPIAS